MGQSVVWGNGHGRGKRMGQKKQPRKAAKPRPDIVVRIEIESRHKGLYGGRLFPPGTISWEYEAETIDSEATWEADVRENEVFGGNDLPTISIPTPITVSMRMTGATGGQTRFLPTVQGKRKRTGKK